MPFSSKVLASHAFQTDKRVLVTMTASLVEGLQEALQTQPITWLNAMFRLASTGW